MDIDGAERHLAHEVHAHHHHPGDPEEDDVVARHQHVAGVVAGQVRRLVRPAERAERPQRRAEPGVEDVLVLGERDALARFGSSLLLGLRLVAGDEDLAVGAIPGGDAVAPPELAADAPGLDFAHPGEERVLPLLGHEARCTRLDGGDGRLGELGGVRIPLHGQQRLDGDAGAVAVRDLVRVRLGAVQEVQPLQLGDDGGARGIAALPGERLHERGVGHAVHGAQLPLDLTRASRAPRGRGCSASAGRGGFRPGSR